MDGQAGDFTSEVVITPDMLRAGVHPFACFDTDFTSHIEGVECVVRAVLVAGGYTITET